MDSCKYHSACKSLAFLCHHMGTPERKICLALPFPQLLLSSLLIRSARPLVRPVLTVSLLRSKLSEFHLQNQQPSPNLCSHQVLCGSKVRSLKWLYSVPCLSWICGNKYLTKYGQERPFILSMYYQWNRPQLFVFSIDSKVGKRMEKPLHWKKA